MYVAMHVQLQIKSGKLINWWFVKTTPLASYNLLILAMQMSIM